MSCHVSNKSKVDRECDILIVTTSQIIFYFSTISFPNCRRNPKMTVESTTPWRLTTKAIYLRASGEGSNGADRGDEDSSRELHFDYFLFWFVVKDELWEKRGRLLFVDLKVLTTKEHKRFAFLGIGYIIIGDRKRQTLQRSWKNNATTRESRSWWENKRCLWDHRWRLWCWWVGKRSKVQELLLIG